MPNPWSNQVSSTLVLIVQSSQQGIFIYSGSAAYGNLIGSWTNAAGTDQYGNSYPAGINVTQGTLSGVLLTSPVITGGSLLSAILSSASVTASAWQGGTISETMITFDQVGGTLLAYGSSTTTVTLTSGTTWTAPAGSYTQGKVECWGGGSGGSGGSASRGAEAGAGGEYAAEPNYPLTPGNVYQIQVGGGGTGAPNGYTGGPGGNTLFDNGGVFANGGQAPPGGYIGGTGGTGSTNTVHYNGGNGANGNSGGSTGGSSGGNSGCPAAAGNNGVVATGSGGAAAPGAQAGGGQGGAGGSNTVNGSGGAVPGGGGGGAGSGSGSVQYSKTYTLSSSGSYYGSDASGGNANNQRSTGSPMYQGGETASGGEYNGTQKTLGIISGNPVSDLAGATIDEVLVTLAWQHTWYNDGAYVYLGYDSRTSLPSSWNAADITSVTSFWQGNVGSAVTNDITGDGLGTAMQNGSAKSITLGPGSTGFDLYNYGYFYGPGQGSLSPSITIHYHTGSSPTYGGNGGGGQIKITYVSSQTLVAALAPAAGSDTAGNAWAAGYTGPVTAIRPSSSPAAAETWHSVALPTGFTGTIRVKQLAESNFAVLDVCATQTTTGSLGAGNNAGTLPSSSYYPSLSRQYPLSVNAQYTTAVNAMPRVSIPTSGSIALDMPGFTQTGVNCIVGATIIYPLD
jgi:hypothetical protein